MSECPLNTCEQRYNNYRFLDTAGNSNPIKTGQQPSPIPLKMISHRSNTVFKNRGKKICLAVFEKMVTFYVVELWVVFVFSAKFNDFKKSHQWVKKYVNLLIFSQKSYISIGIMCLHLYRSIGIDMASLTSYLSPPMTKVDVNKRNANIHCKADL